MIPSHPSSPAASRPRPWRVFRTFQPWSAAVLCAGVFAAMCAACAGADGINLSWDECGTAGTELKTFACGSATTTPFVLIGSFQPPEGVDEFLGTEAELRVASKTLPNWWALGDGQCRSGGLMTDFRFAAGGACSDFYGRDAVGGFLYDLGAFGANTARLRITSAVPIDKRGPVDPGKQYYAFKLLLLPDIGSGSCAGCDVPVGITLNKLQLFQSPEANNDPVIDTPLDRTAVSWQASVGGPATLASFEPAGGMPGQVVHLHGRNLDGTSVVRFNGVEAPFTVVSDSLVDATVPAGARSGPLELITPFGASRTASAFVAAPVIESFLPRQAQPGTDVVVHGRNFSNVSSVKFAGVAAEYQVFGDSALRAIVPAAAADGPIVATNPGGTGGSEVFRVGVDGGVLDLAWDDCGAAGSELKQFACNRDTGAPFSLVASFAPPSGVTQLSGIDADVAVFATELPDWWKHGAGDCRAGLGFNTTFDGPPGGACTDAWTGRASGHTTFELAYYGANSARFHVVGAMPEVSTAAVDPHAEYYAFRLNLLPARSTGGCAGCSIPVRLVLQQIQLLQPAAAAFDPVITAPFHRNSVLWQGAPGPLPRVDDFQPRVGVAGTPVEITGSHFTGATEVRFGNVPSATITVRSDSLISALVPFLAPSGRVLVKTPYGAGASEGVFITPPLIGSFTPGQAPAGATITIHGTNLANVVGVTFNRKGAQFQVVSDSVVTAVAPRNTTDGHIGVNNAAGEALSDGVFHFGSTTVPTPTISSFTPAFGVPGTEVSLAGENLAGATSVTFGGVPATFRQSSDVLVIATVPQSPAIGLIAMTTAGGVAHTSIAFIVPPVIQSFSPLELRPNDEVTILGRNFTQAKGVQFDVEAADFSVRSDSLIEAFVPAGVVATGAVQVSNVAGDGVSAQLYHLSPEPSGGGINLSWDDCGAAGEPDQTFTCDANSGAPLTMVGSFVAPAGITQFVGATAELRVESKADVLPDWWRFGTGTCRGTGISADFNFTEGPFTCLDPTTGRAAGGFVYEIGQHGPNSARIRLTYAVPFDTRDALEAGKEYYAFRVRVTRARSTGAGTCDGCSDAVDITFRQIQLFQPPELHDDPTLDAVAVSAKIRWQPSHGGPNLVRDPSFETSLAGWGPVGGATLDRVPQSHTGTFAMQVTGADSLGEFGINDSPNLVARVPAAHRSYRFLLFARAIGAPSPIQLRMREYSGRVRVQTATSAWVPLTTDWQRVQAQITSLNDSSTIDFQVIGAGPAPRTVFQIDDVEVSLMGSEPVLVVPSSVNATPGVPVEITVTASDPGGEPIHAFVADLSGLPMLNDAVFTPDPDLTRGVLRWTPQPEDADGDYVVPFRVTSVLDKSRSTEIHVAHADPYPLVTNPSFETEVIGWHGYEGATFERVTPGRTGAWALSVHEADSTAEYGINDAPNWVVTTPGAGIPYRFSAWVRAAFGTGVGVLRVREFQGPLKVGASSYSATISLTPEWRQVEVDRVTGAAGSTLDFQVLCYPDAAGTAFNVDDVTIRPLVTPPAPATAAEKSAGKMVFERPTVYPNPFRGRAMLGITLSRPGPMHVGVYDLSGRRVRTVYDAAHAEPGTHIFELDGRDDRGHRLGAGVFFYRIESPNGVQQGRFAMLE